MDIETTIYFTHGQQANHVIPMRWSEQVEDNTCLKKQFMQYQIGRSLG